MPAAAARTVGSKYCLRQRQRLYIAATRSSEVALTVLDLERLRAAPLCRDPFDFVVVEKFLGAAALPPVLADFPAISRHGSFPVEALTYGPAFAGLLAALTGPA